MELNIIPKVGLGKFKFYTKLSEIITELQEDVKIFGKVDIVIDDSINSPIYLYVKKQGKI